MKFHLNVTYSIWKQVAQSNSWATYDYPEGATSCTVWTGDRDHVYESFVGADDYSDWNTNFGSGSTQVARPDDAVAQIVGLSGVKPVPLQSDGAQLVAHQPRLGSEIVIGSHNFCDMVTRYGASLRATDQAMQLKAGTGGKQWESTNSDHVNWIDAVSGRIHNQEHWVALVGHGYAVEVKVDSVVKTPCPPFVFDDGSGSYDYWIDYDNGEINFFVDQTGNTVTASFSYANGSTFFVTPDTGKILRIENAEADFSEDMIQYGTFEYQVVGYVDVFAPQYMRGSNELSAVLDKDLTAPPGSPDTGDRYIVASPATGDWASHEDDIAQYNGSSWDFTTPSAEDWTTVVDESMYYTYRSNQWNMTPYPSGTQIPIQQDYYHRVTQIVTEARGALPTINAIGATAEHKALSDIKEFRRKSRGMKNAIQAVPFNYSTARDLYSSYGMELRVLVGDDSNMGGESLTITFYCTSISESEA